ncbi:MAG: hypothetical protein K6G18_06980 [Treponema sp.]|nr:hypothetical protein [Treponema sp.]
MSSEKRPSRKRHPFRTVLVILFAILLIPSFAALLWFVYAKKDRVSPLSAMPGGWNLILHTDNLWESAGPLLDLKAADTLLTDPMLSNYRAAYMALRQNPLRKHKYAPLLAGRRADLVVYMAGESADFIAVTDSGVFACVTRLAFLLAPFARVEGLEYVKDGGYFIYSSVDKMTGSLTRVYVKAYKNLLVASLSPALLLKAFEKDHSAEHPAQVQELLEAKTGYPFKLVLGAKALVEKAVPEDNIYLSSLASLLGEQDKGLIEFSIDDSDVQLEASIPLDAKVVESSPLGGVMSKKSTVPSMLTRLTDNIQYYTLLHAGSLPELKEAVFPIVQQTQDIGAAWDEGERYAKKLFKSSIEELVFSWTGDEYAILGVDGSSDPVFVLQVGDEAKRQQAFDKLTRSLLIKNNSSLIVDGVRLPCLEMPPLFKSILKMLKIELPRPYYLVHEGYVYFSESPQNLAIVYGRYRAGSTLARNDTWRKINSEQPQELALGLFYNTERSIPFFLQGSGIVTKLLKLYNIGRINFSLDGGSIKAAYHATAVDSYNGRSLPGFPIPLEETPDFNLEEEAGGKAVFWCEGGTVVKSLDFSSLTVSRILMRENCSVTASAQECAGGGVVWVVDEKGTVYLLDRKLQAVRPFPVLTGCRTSAKPAAIGKKLLIPTENGTIILVDDSGKLVELQGPEDGNFKSSPAVLGNIAAAYSKGFEGAVYTIEDGKFTNLDAPLSIDGIAFGSPCLAEEDGILRIAMITQAGDFHLFEAGKPKAGFPISVDGVFYTNVVRADGAWFALSSEAELYRISDSGEHSAVKVPGLDEAKEAWLTTDGERLYVSGSSNYIYAFTSGLEMMYGFPVAGRGKCVVADVNGDGKGDCVALSLDKKLYAWTIR